MYGASNDGFRVENLKDNPNDSVQMMKWMPGQRSSMLATVGWDGKLRVYELVEGNNKPRVELKGGVELNMPVLSVEWAGKASLIAATADGNLWEINTSTGNKNNFAKADGPVVEIKVLEDRDGAALLVFQADEYLLLHNLKGNDRFPTSKIKLKYPIIAADFSEFYLAVACQDSRVAMIEIKDLFSNNPESKFNYCDSGLSSPLTAISLKKVGHIKDSMLVVSTIDGRVGINEISTSSYSSATITLKSLINFRAAKTERGSSYSNNSDLLHNITCIQFISGGRELSDIFLTTAANGDIKLWNATKRIDTLTIVHKNKQISAARVNDDSTLLAYAIGYTWAQGIWGLKDLSYSPEIYIRMLDNKDFTQKNN